MLITQDKFLEIIDSAPLVSLDLIISNKTGRFLLGKRSNRPAQGYWFVPGGRIRKTELISEAFIRITSNEIGIALDPSKANLIGAYDHIYEDNYYAKNGINTHYVALGYLVVLENEVELEIDSQHTEFEWWTRKSLLADIDVHENTKNYFKDPLKFNI